MPRLSARRWKTVGGIRAGLGLGRPAASKHGSKSSAVRMRWHLGRASRRYFMTLSDCAHLPWNIMSCRDTCAAAR